MTSTNHPLLAALNAEWDQAFSDLQAAGLEADADHPIAARYRTAGNALNHANRVSEWSTWYRAAARNDTPSPE